MPKLGTPLVIGPCGFIGIWLLDIGQSQLQIALAAISKSYSRVDRAPNASSDIRFSRSRKTG
jgi:hypothetical protein